MKELKLGDVCLITDIADCDPWYTAKDSLVGKRVKFDGYLERPVKHRGYIACCVLFFDPIPSLGIWIDRGSCFHCVKLEKTKSESPPTHKASAGQGRKNNEKTKTQERRRTRNFQRIE